jgi:malonyl-CoA/methylmalonyl-CoA synthetase
VPDAEWGERVAAAVVLNEGEVLDLASFRAWARELLATHKLPSRLLVVDALPRNALGKVMKPAVAALFQTSDRDLRPNPAG